MAAQSKPFTVFGLLRRIITYWVPPPKAFSPGTNSVEDNRLADANTSYNSDINSQCTQEEAETYRAQLGAMSKSALSMKMNADTADTDTADTDSMSATIRNGQIDLEWDQGKCSRRTRRRGGCPEKFSAAADAFRSELQQYHFAKRQEEQRLKKKQKDFDDYIKAVMDRIAELDGMVASQRDMVAKAVKEQTDTKEADKKQADRHDSVFECVNSRVEELGKKTQDDTNLLKSDWKELSDKCNALQSNEAAMKNAIEANEQSLHQLRGRIYVLENPAPVSQAKVADLQAAVATPNAGTEQPQAKTRGYDPKKVSALTTKTKDHDRQLERLETAVSDISPMLEKASEWHEWAGKKFEKYDKHLEEDDPSTLKAIQAAEEQQNQQFNEALAKQKELFEQQLQQQNEQSDKQLSECKETMQEGMRLHEASIRKECDDRLAAKDKEVSERLAKIDAEQKEQKQRNDNLEKTMKDMIAQFHAQIAIQQSPSPAQGQQVPVAHPLQPVPAPHGNGSWSSTPTPPYQGGQQRFRAPEVQSTVPDLDDPMMEAPPLNPQQPSLQSVQPNFGGPEDTTMSSDEPTIPNNSGNVGFLPNRQPTGSSQLFSATGPAQPSPAAPIPSVPSLPTDKRGPRLQRSLFGLGASRHAIPSGQMSLPILTANPARVPAPQKLDFNTPPPDWSSAMDLDNDDAASLPAKGKQPLPKPTPATPLVGEQVASSPGPTITVNAGSSSSMSGTSSIPTMPKPPAPRQPSVAKPKKKPNLFIDRKPKAAPAKSNDVTSKGQTTNTREPRPSPAEERRKLANLQQKFLAGDFNEFPSLSAFPPLPEGEEDREPPPPENPSELNIPGLTGAVNTSPFAKKLEKPKKPVSTLMTPPHEPRTSSPANFAATSGTIATSSTANIFMKDVEKPVEQPSRGNGPSAPRKVMGEVGNAAAGVAEPAKPADDPDVMQTSTAESKPDDIQMSAVESRNPEPPKSLKYEVDVNPRKHAAAVQIVPREEAKTVKRDTQDDAKAHMSDSQGEGEIEMGNSQGDVMAYKQDSQGDDHMETDRRVAKPKGKATKLTAAERKRETDKFQQEAAWDEMEKALAWGAAQKEKAAAAAADDEVDYGDPNDANDEDLSKTTMAAPLPKVRPTKYSIAFFNEWRSHFLSLNSLSSKAAGFNCRTKEDFEAFAKEVEKHDAENDLGHLLEQAALPLKTQQGYTRYEMEKLIFTYREEVYFDALRALDLDELDDDFEITHQRFKADIVSWFRHHSPDTV